nr:MAG TPA: hypothetical protein [Caudoviricetes sp.]
MPLWHCWVSTVLCKIMWDIVCACKAFMRSRDDFTQ